MDTQPSNSSPLPPPSEDTMSGTPSPPLPPPSEDTRRDSDGRGDQRGKGRGRQTKLFTIINNYYE